MAIRYVTGNLLDSGEPVILHGCNAQGKFESGVAGAIKARWPWARQAYLDHHAQHGLKLGDIIPARSPDGRILVLNAVTQQFYGRDGRRYVDYDAIRRVTRFIEANVTIAAVAMPLIGAGLGGGSWKTISGIVDEELQRVRATVYLMDGMVPQD